MTLLWLVKRLRSFVVFFSLLLLPLVAEAQMTFVRAGATGSGNGSDWTNARTCIPTRPARGTVVYVADGDYRNCGPPTFDTPVSGTTLITIKKAIIADHGTNVGWNDTFGDGQAIIIGRMRFDTGFWTVDGQVRTSLSTGHGFVVDNSGGAELNRVVDVGDSGGPGGGTAVSNVTLLYIDVTGSGSRNDAINDRAVQIVRGSTNILISHCYVHDPGQTTFQVRDVDGLIIEECLIARNHSSSAFHSEAISDSGSDNVIIRNNVFLDIEGTGGIINLNSGNVTIANNWQIYGNVFRRGTQGQFGNGAIACINSQECHDWLIYNNTFANIVGSARVQMTGVHTNIQVKNNLWFNCDNATHIMNTSGVDSNYYINTTFTAGESRAQSSPTTDPFFDVANGDVRLKRATNGGVMLTAPFDVDPRGKARGTDNIWDRGAFEFLRPNPPRNLRVAP